MTKSRTSQHAVSQNKLIIQCKPTNDILANILTNAQHRRAIYDLIDFKRPKVTGDICNKGQKRDVKCWRKLLALVQKWMVTKVLPICCCCGLGINPLSMYLGGCRSNPDEAIWSIQHLKWVRIRHLELLLLFRVTDLYEMIQNVHAWR